MCLCVCLLVRLCLSALVGLWSWRSSPVGSSGVQVELALFGRVVVAALAQAARMVELDVLASGALAHHGPRLPHRSSSFVECACVFVYLWLCVLVGSVG